MENQFFYGDLFQYPTCKRCGANIEDIIYCIRDCPSMSSMWKNLGFYRRVFFFFFFRSFVAIEWIKSSGIIFMYIL